MDEADRSLVDRHGYASQEAVNLLLVGKACSNVFDGDRTLSDEVRGSSDAVILKGVPRTADVGLLTLHEAYGQSPVGDRLKRPRRPVWVVYSESHYSVLVCPADDSDRKRFDVFYWDGLAGQDERIRLTIDAAHYDDRRTPPDPDAPGALVPPLDLVVRTRWPRARVDWNDAEPIL